jgi:Uma2 family endonuclease
MGAIATRMTAEEFFAATVEGDRPQLVEGAVVVDEPLPIHGVLQVRLGSALQRWTEEGPGRGLVVMPTGVVMDEHNVFGPDILWIAESHRPVDLTERLGQVPDLCVEIRSPSTWRYDVGAKKSVYERGGLPELWLVDDVAETVLVFRRSSSESGSFDVALELEGADSLGSPQLPGFALALDDLFPGRAEGRRPS